MQAYLRLGLVDVRNSDVRVAGGETTISVTVPYADIFDGHAGHRVRARTLAIRCNGRFPYKRATDGCIFGIALSIVALMHQRDELRYNCSKTPKVSEPSCLEPNGYGHASDCLPVVLSLSHVQFTGCLAICYPQGRVVVNDLFCPLVIR